MGVPLNINQLEKFIQANIKLNPQFMIVVHEGKIRVRSIEG